MLSVRYGSYYSKTCLKRPLRKKTKIGFQDRLSLNAGPKYCRMLQESILQNFRPSLSYHWSLTWILCKNQKIPIGVRHATSGIFLILCV